MLRITYFVHCPTTDNQRGLATGWLAGELSELGMQRARELGKKLAGRRFDAVISSDLKRAVDTAAIVFGAGNFTTDERLREANFGKWTGRPKTIFKDRLEDFIHTPFPGGESLQNVENRMRAFCDDLILKHNGKHIALMSHHAPQLALEVIADNKTWPQAIAEDWRNTGAYQPGWVYRLG